jgi:hypothetical protein
MNGGITYVERVVVQEVDWDERRKESKNDDKCDGGRDRSSAWASVVCGRIQRKKPG